MRATPTGFYEFSPRGRARARGSAVGTVGVALLLAACGGGAAESGDRGEGASGGEEVTITVASWAAAEEATRDGFLEVVAAFEADHPGIAIENEPIPFSDIEQTMLRRVQAGNAPDVAQVAGNYTFNLHATGALEPLDDLAGDAYKDALIPEVLDVVTVDGAMIAAPWNVQPVGFWYNRDLMEEAGLDPESPPTTIDELLDMLATIQQELPDVIGLGIDSTNRVFGLDVSWPWMRAFGAEPFDQDGSVAIDSPEMRDYLDFMGTLAREGYTEVNQTIGYFRPIAAEDNVVFIWDQPVLQGVVQETAGIDEAAFHDKWGVTTIPVAGGSAPSTVPEDHQLTLLATSEQKEAAWTFIEWITTSEEGLTYAIEQGGLVPLAEPDGTVDALVTDSPALQAFRTEIVPTSARPPWGPDFGQAYEPIMVGVQEMMTTSSATSDAVAGDVQGQVENALG